MKPWVFFKLVKALQSNAATWRKVKIFAVVGFVGFLFVGGAVIWAGISAVSYAATTANQFLLSPESRREIETVVGDLAKIQLQPAGCWESAQRLLAVQPWFEKPILDNVNTLKAACFETRAMPDSEGEVI